MMKNTPRFILLLLLATTMCFFSCQKDNSKITIVLSVDIEGNLMGPSTVTYKDEYGEKQTENLNGNWSKAFQTDHRADIFLNAQGTISGSVILKNKAFTCKGSFTEGSTSTTALDYPRDFNLKIEEEVVKR